MGLKGLLILTVVLVVVYIHVSEGKKKHSDEDSSGSSENKSDKSSGEDKSEKDSDSSSESKEKHKKKKKKHQHHDSHSKKHHKGKKHEKKGSDEGGKKGSKEGEDEDNDLGAAAPDMPKPIHVTKKIERGFISLMFALANSTSEALVDVAAAAHKLLSDLAEEDFGLLNAITFVPEFLLTDVPTQFEEILQDLQEHMKKGDLELDNAFETLMKWADQIQENTGQAQLKLSSFITFWPGIINSFKKFYRTSLDALYKTIEARK